MKTKKKAGYITAAIKNAPCLTLGYIAIRLFAALCPSIVVVVMANFVDAILGGNDAECIIEKAVWLVAIVGISRFSMPAIFLFIIRMLTGRY